jgi:hypothetical protein
MSRQGEKRMTESPDQVLIGVDLCGICGSDLHAADLHPGSLGCGFLGRWTRLDRSSRPVRKMMRLSEYQPLLLGFLQTKSPNTSPPDNASVAILR